jgi:dipeptidyl-peptidase 4
MTTDEERRLTHDGVERYGYATDNEGWRRSDRPAVRWSPDSRRIATYRLDERGVGEMHLWQTVEGRPRPPVVAVRPAR